MKYENFEKAIAARLDFKGVDVSTLPLPIELNKARQTTKPQLFVIFTGADYGERENLGVMAQVETLHFEISIFARKRLAKLGIYELFETITKQLLGYKLPHARTKISFDKFGYVSETTTTWQYALLLSFTSYIVERDNVNDEPLAPLIKQITNNLTSM